MFGKQKQYSFIRLAPDKDDNGDVSGTEDGKKTPQEQALEGLLGRMGDANKVALYLLDENYRLRGKNRDLQEKQVKDGQVVISTAEKGLLDSYTALGTPEALQQARQDLENSKRVEHIRAAAEVSGFKPSVLGTLLKDEKLEIRQETVDGKSVPYVVVIKDGQAAVNLVEYASETWTDFLPSLQANASQVQPQGDSSLQTTFPRQVRGEKPKADNPVAQRIAIMDERAKGKNPLVRE